MKDARCGASSTPKELGALLDVSHGEQSQHRSVGVLVLRVNRHPNKVDVLLVLGAPDVPEIATRPHERMRTTHVRHVESA